MQHATRETILNTTFLPINQEDMAARGWDELDFIVVGGDTYVDHPSFGTAIISRLLEAEGYRVGVLAQPRFTDCEDFKRFGKPKYGFFIGGGNVDSMVSHYSVAKIARAEDEYSPGGVAGARPDRSATVYSQLAKQAYPDLPVILGGLEASLRRFAHYDYWDDSVMPSIAETSGADLISFGMGEHQTAEIARRLVAGEEIRSMTDIDGTCYMTDFDHLPTKYIECAGFAKVSTDKLAYAKATRIQMDNQDCVIGQIIIQKQQSGYLVQNIPSRPLTRPELDRVHALPFTRRYHPCYEAFGGVPAIREVQFSIIQNRGCFGGCNFCAIALHQGRRVTSRSADSIVAEGEAMTHEPDFKGYIHDVGGPTANFRFPSCAQQMKNGMCMGGKHCLAPQTCPKMILDHSDYLKILRRLRALPGVKKVFIRSGIRFDYLMSDKDDAFFKELVEHHVSGQLKVAPEHCAPNTLAYMGKPPIEVFNKFKDKFYDLSKKAGKKQFLVPYLMSSHPGSTLKDAVYLAEYLYNNRMKPEQVQDFYPTPGTVSTCMFYTGLDPYTLKPVFVEKTHEGKALQRALLQYYEPRNAAKVIEALKLVHREDLIPKLVPASGRHLARNEIAAQGQRGQSAARVNIHGDGTYTVQHGKQQGKRAKNGAGEHRRAQGSAQQPPAGGRALSPGARFAPNGSAKKTKGATWQEENQTARTQNAKSGKRAKR
ncbi:MAG: YgiQ family radical SAM protein [Faecalibacterium sp.]